MATAVASEPVKFGAPELRKKPRIRDIKENSQTNMGYRSVVAVAPVGFTEEDLKDPECWDGSKLRLHDHVYVMSPDESWTADGVITFTNNKDAVFSMSKLHRFNRQRDNLFEDDRYRVVARLGVFDVIDKRTGQPVAEGLANEALAFQEIKNQYPRRVG